MPIHAVLEPVLAHSAERRFGRAEAAGAEPAESSTRSWWNGRHNGFRSRRRKTWEFKSLRAHQICPFGGMADAAVSKAAVFRDVQVRVLLGGTNFAGVAETQDAGRLNRPASQMHVGWTPTSRTNSR